MQTQINLLYKRMAAIEEKVKNLESSSSSSSSPSSRDAWFLSKKIEALEKIAQDIKNRGSSEVAFGTQWDDPAEREEYLKIRREIRELNQKIANMKV